MDVLLSSFKYIKSVQCLFVALCIPYFLSSAVDCSQNHAAFKMSVRVSESVTHTASLKIQLYREFVFY
jgi:hypothetical protein